MKAHIILAFPTHGDAYVLEAWKNEYIANARAEFWESREDGRKTKIEVIWILNGTDKEPEEAVLGHVDKLIVKFYSRMDEIQKQIEQCQANFKADLIKLKENKKESRIKNEHLIYISLSCFAIFFLLACIFYWFNK